MTHESGGKTYRNTTADAIPNMETAYQELRPLLFRALGRQARQGFLVSPADGLDLIHDFFAEEWKKVERTYDPSRGNYKAYSYGAFVRFVRHESSVCNGSRSIT